MPNRTSFSEVPAARVPRFGDSGRIKAAKLVAPARISINEPKFIMGAVDMGLAQELTLAEATKPLTAFRYLSFEFAGTMTDFASAGLAVIAAEAGQFTKPDSLSLPVRVGERRRDVLSGTALAY